LKIKFLRIINKSKLINHRIIVAPKYLLSMFLSKKDREKTTEKINGEEKGIEKYKRDVFQKEKGQYYRYYANA